MSCLFYDMNPGEIRGLLKAFLHKKCYELLEYEAGLYGQDLSSMDQNRIHERVEAVCLRNVDKCIVAHDLNEIIGVLISQKDNPTQISVLYVNEGHRRSKVGHKLVKRFVNMFPRQPITVECLVVNTKAKAFYESLRFVFSPELVKERNIRGVFQNEKGS